MVNVAQLVRAPDCDSGGRGFEPHLSPEPRFERGFLLMDFVVYILQSEKDGSFYIGQTGDLLSRLASRSHCPLRFFRCVETYLKRHLQTRPIFHFKEQPIKLHLLICFMALVVLKHIELKTGISIRKLIDESKKVVEGEILNHAAQKIVTVKAKPTPKMIEMTNRIFSPN